MKTLATVLVLFVLLVSCNSQAQILLRGYKCIYFDDQPPYMYADMYSKTDTFSFVLYSRDIMGEVEDNDPVKELKCGLRLCFGINHYIRTKDSLYIYTGKYYDTNIYVYKVYIPNKMVALSVRSKNNDALFSERSTWLLSQIRLNRAKDMYFINEKHQTCQDRNDDRR